MNHDNWFDAMAREGLSLTPEQKRKVEEKINAILNYEPRVGVFGKTGVGKSSLCNALFGQDIFPISDVAACTRNPQEVLLRMGSRGLKLVDVPGVGENQQRDEEYARLYTKLLPELDLVLWLLKADDRAYSDDQKFYNHVVKPHLDQGKPFFFVVNQADKIEPFREWDERRREPGPRQLQNIQRKTDSIADMFGVPPSRVIPVSANEKYNLTKLVDEIVFALPNEKKITVFKNVSNEFKSQAAVENVKSGFWETLGDVVEKVVGHAVKFIVKGLSKFFKLFF